MNKQEIIDELKQTLEYNDHYHVDMCNIEESLVKNVITYLESLTQEVSPNAEVSNAEAMREEIKRLKFMIDNGLGWDDIKNDINYPNEI